jgi:hypothetical protein
LKELDKKDQELSLIKADKTQVTELEEKIMDTYLTKDEFTQFVKSYNDFNEKNKSDFESKNEKVLDLISKLDTFKANLARIEKANK